MFWVLFAVSLVICLPGIYFMFQTEKKMPNNNDISDKERLIAHFILVGLFGAIGALLIPKVSVIPTEFDLYMILKIGLLFGVICSLGNMLLYYFLLVKFISNEDYFAIEKHYKNMGILSRVFYGGFVEEIIFRWGIMSLILWVLQLLSLSFNGISNIIAIGISGLLFSLAHLPSIKLVVKEPKSVMYVYTILGNMWVGVFTGWTLLKAGIFSAIIVHVLFHLLWYPIQRNKQAHLKGKIPFVIKK